MSQQSQVQGHVQPVPDQAEQGFAAQGLTEQEGTQKRQAEQGLAEQRETENRQKTERALRSRAVRLLAQREHSKDELRRKLTGRDTDAATVERVLDTLIEGNLQSDTRFVDELVRSRIARGQGPLRIRADLEGRGIADEEIDAALTQSASFWLERLNVVRRKRFGSAAPADRAAWGRQARFLAQRGFPADLIYRGLDAAE